MWLNGNTSAEKHERVMTLLAKMFAMVMEKVLNKKIRPSALKQNEQNPSSPCEAKKRASGSSHSNGEISRALRLFIFGNPNVLRKLVKMRLNVTGATYVSNICWSVYMFYHVVCVCIHMYMFQYANFSMPDECQDRHKWLWAFVKLCKNWGKPDSYGPCAK